MFLDELNRIMDSISRDPALYPIGDFGTRKAVLRRFPYLVVFRVSSSKR
jgi:hypothetical protein